MDNTWAQDGSQRGQQDDQTQAQVGAPMYLDMEGLGLGTVYTAVDISFMGGPAEHPVQATPLKWNGLLGVTFQGKEIRNHFFWR